MKRVKNYIDTELAKKKLARYKYWSVKDENGITIQSVDDNNTDDKTFAEVLDKIIADNVDAEVQIKYGTNEQSARQNPPFFIRVNEQIEWIEPEPDDMVKINGVPHPIDKNGNVNINLTTRQEPIAEQAEIITTKDELEIRLDGLRRENELKQEGLVQDMHNKLAEQSLKFKEMLLAEKETRLNEREQAVVVAEQSLGEQQREIQSDLKGYLREVPSAIGGLVKDWIRDTRTKKEKGLGGTEKDEEKKPRKRNKVKFSVDGEPDSNPTPEPEQEPEESTLEKEIEEEIAMYAEQEQEPDVSDEVTAKSEPEAGAEDQGETSVSADVSAEAIAKEEQNEEPSIDESKTDEE